jgi:hypothetical protein
MLEQQQRTLADAVTNFCSEHNIKPETVAISAPWAVNEEWPVAGLSWPNAQAQGVYLVFAADSTLLYVGKAAGTKNRIGHRLAVWFLPNLNGAGRMPNAKHKWSAEPRFIITTGVADAHSYLVSAIEQFLILKLKPSDNTLRPYAA